MCKNIGLEGRQTNLSCTASTATKLCEKGVDEQLICEKTGHHSVAVGSYKRNSNQQMRQVSDILSDVDGPSEVKIAKKYY